ncbi:protein monoglycylase TTLL8-like [Convolutriloba macropyga]|uniref:protein monoglycylase TTLL8-like n=1 Tax=Convolutriloba macropyga TaxID=536237 RepID=UPI003F51E3C8
MRLARPMTDVDGVKNMWICKPGALSRGRGITCQTQLPQILSMVSSTPNPAQKEGKIVVQKYIERCLLIYDTKFDIRQWFLVTDWNPLTVWYYKDCYIRLCSQLYSLERLDKGTHLSNNSIQAYFQNDKNRSHKLPEENMMTSDQFDKYLREEGHGTVYHDSIYPRMKSIITWAMQCSQESMENAKGCFELYGADFVIGSDLSVWLIEINSSPALTPSTQITRTMCAQVLEDTVKVVIDKKTDRMADTGRFELAIKQDFIPQPTYCGQNLALEGTQIKKSGPSGHPTLQRSITEGSNLKLKLLESRNKPVVKTRSQVAPRQTFTSVNIAELHSYRCPPTPVNDHDSFFKDWHNPKPELPQNKLQSQSKQTSNTKQKSFDLRSDLELSATSSVANRIQEQNRKKLQAYMRSSNDRQNVLRHLSSYNFESGSNLRPTSKESFQAAEKSLLRSQGLNLESSNTLSSNLKTVNIPPDRKDAQPRKRNNNPNDSDQNSVAYGRMISQRQKEAVHKIYGAKNSRFDNQHQLEILKSKYQLNGGKQSFYYMNSNNHTVFSN